LAEEPPLIALGSVRDVEWEDVQSEVVTFIDGGVGNVQIATRVPILLRVGSYCVRIGERELARREQFGYYPIVLGDLEGGSHDRKDFIDIVRITSELLGGLAALERTPDLRVLMFHGPLVYLVGSYAGHTPFTEKDIDLFLRHFGSRVDAGRQLKEEFLREASLVTYPAMVGHDRWAQQRMFEPLAWMAFLYRRLIQVAKARAETPIIAGVVERGAMSEFAEKVLLERVFRGLRAKANAAYFNQLFGRGDLASPTSLVEKLGYSDGLLLAMLLEPGQYSEPWEVAKYAGLRDGQVAVHGEPGKQAVSFAPLASGLFGFPAVEACYVQVTRNSEPVRVEVFKDLGPSQISAAAARTFLYSSLLPRYGFPVGLDVVDKYAHVPAWLSNAYGKLIRHHLGVSLQTGEISDAETRRLLIQAIYMTNRDWLFRPTTS
jgi:hypothetical protein